MYSQQDGSRAFMALVVAAMVMGVVAYVHLQSQIVELRAVNTAGQGGAKVTSVAAAPIPSPTGVPTTQPTQVAAAPVVPVTQSMGQTNSVATLSTAPPVQSSNYGFMPQYSNNSSLPRPALPEVNAYELRRDMMGSLSFEQSKSLKERSIISTAIQEERPTQISTRSAAVLVNEVLVDADRMPYNGASRYLRLAPEYMVALLRHVAAGWRFNFISWAEVDQLLARYEPWARTDNRVMAEYNSLRADIGRSPR